MKKKFIYLSIILLQINIYANSELKKAFSEGIKASIEVIKYEKSQALKTIPEGYCVTVTNTENSLNVWEEVKLESLALFLKLNPSLLGSKKKQEDEKRILCLSITKEKKEAIEALEKIKKLYPKIEKYITKVEILPTKILHRTIPGVGEYFENKDNEIMELKLKLSPDIPLDTHGILLGESSKIHYDNGSTRVVGTKLKNVLYIEHTVYSRIKR